MLEFSSEPGYPGRIVPQRSSVWIAVGAGFLAALTAAILVCRSPQSATPQFALVFLAGVYLLVTALSGATGSYFYWIRSRSWSASELTKLLESTVSGWVWIPAIVLLSRQDSVWAPAVAAAGAVVLAVSLRKSGSAAFHPVLAEEPVSPAQLEIFAQSLQTAPAEWYGPVVAICLFSEVFVLARGWLFPACALLALAGFAFAWARTPALSATPPSVRRISAATLHQTKSALPALTVTVFALFIGARHDIQEWELGAGLAHRHGAGDPLKTQKDQARIGLGGHFSIVLLSAPEKQQFLAPQVRNPLIQGSRLAKPMVIQFDGEYWYFQPPDPEPGRSAYKARGNPLGANIHSNSAIPLMMRAHQHLSAPLPLTCCREINVEIENRADRSGALAVGMMLTDTAAPDKPSLLVGEEPVVSNGANPPAGPSGFAHTTLRFLIPPQSGPKGKRLQQFDQIDFVIVPDPTHAQSGAKMAIRTLELIP